MQKEEMSEKNKGKIHIYNPILDIAKNINKDDPIPEGWIRGQRPKTEEQRKQNSEYRKGTIKIYNKELDIEKYHKKELPIPEGFVIGTRRNQRGNINILKDYI